MEVKMRLPNLATDVSEVVENIKTYNEAAATGRLRTMIAYVQHWYAAKAEDGSWLFGPSKFIGYAGITPKIYEQMHKELNGRVTETVLKDWFVELSAGDALHAVLRQELRRFIAEHGKSLNHRAQIHVLKNHAPSMTFSQKPVHGEGWRITSSAEMLSGKPCIRGLRIRVADILEMLALGATRKQILEDYPYLEDGDITAALEFAVGAVDHRLVKAA
jgi:uncharacterized protein (DUF433 family)